MQGLVNCDDEQSYFNSIYHIIPQIEPLFLRLERYFCRNTNSRLHEKTAFVPVADYRVTDLCTG